MTKSEYLTEYDGIAKTMQMYIDGSKQGKSELMRPAFHPDASFFGYAGEQLATGTKFLFDWIDKNGPAPKIEPRVVSVDILNSIAVVRLEVAGWSETWRVRTSGCPICSPCSKCRVDGKSSRRRFTGTPETASIAVRFLVYSLSAYSSAGGFGDA